MLGCVLGNTTQVCLDDMVAVQEGELAGGLDPDLQRELSISNNNNIADET